MAFGGSRSGMGEPPRLQGTPSGGLLYEFVTRYRTPVLRGEIGTQVRELIQEICRTPDIEIVHGHSRPEHIHLLLSVPPHLAPSRVMQAMKGKTSHHLQQDRRKLRAEFWGRHL